MQVGIFCCIHSYFMQAASIKDTWNRQVYFTIYYTWCRQVYFAAFIHIWCRQVYFRINNTWQTGIFLNRLNLIQAGIFQNWQHLHREVNFKIDKTWCRQVYFATIFLTFFFRLTLLVPAYFHDGEYRGGGADLPPQIFSLERQFLAILIFFPQRVLIWVSNQNISPIQ